MKRRLGSGRISPPANRTKFQAICVGKNAYGTITFKTDSVEIKCEDNVTLLSVNIDFKMLSFDDYVTDIRKKASKQLTVLKCLGRFLT